MKNILLILILFATTALPNVLSGQAVVFKIDTVSVSCAYTDTVKVPIKVKNFQAVGSFQFTVSWDTAHIKFLSTTTLNTLLQGAGVNFGFDISTFIHQNPAKITFNWTKVGGGSVPDETVLFYLVYKRLGGPFVPIQMVNSPVVVEVTNPLGDDIPHVTIPGGIKPLDSIKPTLSCPANVSLTVSIPSAVNNIAPSNISDNCAVSTVGWASTGATTANMPADPDASGFVFNFGVSTVTYTVTDVGGNTSSCSFKVTLEPSLTSDTLTLYAQNVGVSCGQNASINIAALNFDAMGSLQFSLKWDTSVIKFVNINGFNPALNLAPSNFGVSFTNSGVLSFNWTTSSLSGTTLPPGATLFTLNFTVSGASGSVSSIQFVDIPAIREAYENVGGLPTEIPAIWINGSVSVQDSQAPTLVCPPNVLANAPIGSLSTQVNGLQPITLSDNCSGLVSLNYVRTGLTTGSGTGNANGVYNAGATTVTYTAMDQAGNSSTCSFQVVVDAGTPVSLALDSLASDCSAAGSQVTTCVHVADFADIVGLQFSVTWNPAVLQFNGTNNQYPGLNLTSGNFNGYANVATGLLQFFGGNANGWPDIPNGGDFFCIVFTVLDANASSAISFTGPFDAANSALDPVPISTQNGFFESVDQSPPSIVCPSNISVTAPLGSCTATVNIPSPQVSDACSGVAQVIRTHPSNVFQAGSSVVTYTATDNVGLSASCSLTVTVQANSTPIISNCPANQSVNAQGSNCSAVVNWQAPLAIDACGINPITPVPNIQPNTAFQVGTTQVIYTATDAQGNSSLCSFSVTVKDVQKPNITCPGSYVLPHDSLECCVPGGYQIPVASDNCDNVVAVAGNYTPNDLFCVGTTLVSYTATDDFGNTASCTFTITVLDEYAPAVVKCPTDISVSTSPNNCGATVNWDIPIFNDVCDGTSLTIIHVYNPNTLFPIGETQVDYYATDSSFNVALCSFKVKVEDKTPPTLSGCPNDISVVISGVNCDTILNWPAPLAIDNCPNISLSSLPASNTPFPAGASTVVTYTAKDGSGNTATCSFNVSVQEKRPPTFSNCPSNFLLQNVDPCTAIPAWTAFPSAVDNCSSVVIDSSDYRPGDVFPVGVTIVTITATDESGNVDTCSFSVNVIGIPPGFTKIPEDITLQGCTQEVQWLEPIVVGICNLDTIESNYHPGDTFQPGSTTVVYKATDTDGNTVTVSFVVNIVDDVPPVVICPDGPIVVNVGGQILSDPSSFLSNIDTVSSCDGVKLSFEAPSASDNCLSIELTQTDGNTSGDVFPLGDQTLQYIATDGSGNTTLCEVDIQVKALANLNPVSTPSPICNEGTVVITLTEIEDAVYIWNGPRNKDTLQVNQYNVVIGKENDVYTVFAAVNGCKTKVDTVRLQLVQAPDAINDTFYIQPGQIDTLNVLLNDHLSFGDFGVITYQPEQINGLRSIGNGKFIFDANTGTKAISFFYQLCSGICSNLCDKQMATVYIFQKDEDCSFIPNTFTPNGDNNHDKFSIPCIDLLEKPCTLVVYNQWGDKVYESKDYDNSWDGTLNGKGKPLPDGTYYYIFVPSNAGGTTKKGFVEIIR